MPNAVNERLRDERNQLIERRANESGAKPVQIVRVWEQLFGGVNHEIDHRFMEWLRSERCTADIAAELGSEVSLLTIRVAKGESRLWKFRVLSNRILSDYLDDLARRVSQPDAESSYELDVSLMPFAEGYEGPASWHGVIVKADSLDDLHAALLEAIDGPLVGGFARGQTLRTG